MPELVDEYLVQIYKISLDLTRDDINDFVERMSRGGWNYVREDEVIDGIRLKFTKGINEFAAD